MAKYRPFFCPRLPLFIDTRGASAASGKLRIIYFLGTIHPSRDSLSEQSGREAVESITAVAHFRYDDILERYCITRFESATSGYDEDAQPTCSGIGVCKKENNNAPSTGQ